MKYTVSPLKRGQKHERFVMHFSFGITFAYLHGSNHQLPVKLLGDRAFLGYVMKSANREMLRRLQQDGGWVIDKHGFIDRLLVMVV